ncbi:MAG: 50S ribosomal protein L5 [Patescibacteria group bacterium]|jgi:large subunit ribosomal protein L5|nr:50S ribosomal protein L5 [Patescibacteria group bacterium]MDD5172923.1 50S ribosomal protein L5 [Patescibacteria group bacterium]
MNLKEHYFKKVIPKLTEIFEYKNKHAIPKIDKVIVNVGLNRAMTEKDQKYIDLVMETISKITGQRPVVNLSKKSIAGFKIREGIPVGMHTTLRGQKMYDFMGKLINIALARIRDFRGLDQRNIDQKGNLSIGLREQTIFPEILQESIEKTHGLQVVITTTAKRREEAIELFKLLGFPFRRE